MTVTDPLDDIPDVIHKKFMKGYLKDWPNLPQTQYSVGRIIHVELNGIQKKCEVLQVDCSLVQVVFQVSYIKYCSLDYYLQLLYKKYKILFVFIKNVRFIVICVIIFRKLNTGNGYTEAPYAWSICLK